MKPDEVLFVCNTPKDWADTRMFLIKNFPGAERTGIAQDPSDKVFPTTMGIGKDVNGFSVGIFYNWSGDLGKERPRMALKQYLITQFIYGTDVV